MCGIAGVLTSERSDQVDRRVAAMVEMLTHRGPDSAGLFSEGSVSLGMRRLRIIDLTTGEQPMVSGDGTKVIVYNGEVYNYKELRRELQAQGVQLRTTSDTEVILELFAREGVSSLTRLNGMFAFAIYDRTERALWLARDRLGKKPLYYAAFNGTFGFASEIKSLLRYGFPPRLNTAALELLLAYNYVPMPHTMFEGIRRLRPGHWMRVTPDGGVVEHRYWQLPATGRRVSGAEAAADLRWLIERSVEIRLRSDVPLGAFLSGGLDSSTIVALMTPRLISPTATFSIGFPEARYSELPEAAEVAALFQTHHRTRVVEPEVVAELPRVLWHLDQPHGDASFMPMLRLAELAREDVTVVLTGDGGDELFGGYEKYVDFLATPGRIGADADRDFIEFTSVFDASARANLLVDGARVDVVEPVRDALEGLPADDVVNRILNIDTLLLLEGNNLVKPDRMGMAVSLEARCPFLDVGVVEYAARLPGELKVHQAMKKVCFKQSISAWLPDHIVNRRKQMFTVPIGEWFRGHLRSFVTEALLQKRTRERGIFNYHAVERMLSNHVEGRANHTRELRLLLSVELWLRMFVDDVFNSPPDLEDLGLSVQGLQPTPRGGGN